MCGHDTERQDARDLAVGEAADGDDRAGALPRADMALPCRQPVERLERGAVGGAFEAPPFGFDGVQIAIDAQIKARHLAQQQVAAARACCRADVDRSGFVLKRRQCRGARHCTHWMNVPVCFDDN